MKKVFFALWATGSLLAVNGQDALYSVNNWGSGGITQLTGIDANTGAVTGAATTYAGSDPQTLGAAVALSANGYLYYIPVMPGNQGEFTVYSIPAYPSAGVTTAPANGVDVLRGDANQPANAADLYFRRLSDGPDGWVYGLTSEEGSNNVYLFRFLTGSGGTASNLQQLGTITLEGQAPAANFNNGDIALDGSGNLYALVNLDQPGGEAVIYYADKAAISSTGTGVTNLVKKLDVVDQDGDNFTGPVVGLALSSAGNFYIAVQHGTEGGIYFMHRSSASDSTITISGPVSTVNAGNIADLAASYLPVNTILPVVYGPIDASLNGSTLDIRWSTYSETNNQRFEVEVSAGGKHFRSIGTVDSKAVNGNSDHELHYHFTKTIDQQMAMTGIAVVVLGLIAFGLFRQRRWLAVPFLVLGLATTLGACSRSADAIQTDADGKLFVRLKQYDIDGKSSTTEVFTAYTRY